MLIPDHTMRHGITAWWCVLAAMFSVVASTRALAQESAFESASAIARWVAGGTEPEWADSDLSAAKVEIRFERQLVGEGKSIGDSCARIAAEAAMTGLRAHARGQVDGLGPSLAVSVELAGAWIPLTAAELASPDLMLRRGIDSVAVRAGQEERVTFASAFHGVSPLSRSMKQELSNLAASGLGDSFAAALSPEALAEQRSVRFYRFEAEHWAQVAPGGMLVRLHRGGRVPDPNASMRPQLPSELASALAANLVRRAQLADSRSRWSAINVLIGEPGGEDASLLAKATVLLALERTGEVLGLERGTLDAADGMWQALAAGEEKLLPQVAGMLAMADVRSTMPGPLRERVDASLDSVMDELESIPWRGTPSEAIGLWALAERRGQSAEDRARISRALGEVVAERGAEGMVSLLPWSAWADDALHPDKAMQSQAALREVRDVMWAHQFEQADAVAGSEDFVGGLVFARGGLPSAASIRPMVFAAWALGDGRLTTREEALGTPNRRGELLRVLGGIGFIERLAVDAFSAYRSELPARVVGGVRRTLWDSEVHAEDTAIALLACLEAIESMTEIPAE